MNILRLSTFPLTLAIAVFALGYNPSFADNPANNNHPHGGGGKDASYSVVISGAVSGANGTDNWHGNFGGKSRIGLNIGGGGVGDDNNVGQLTDLSFFTDSSNGPWSDPRGANCFSELAYLGQVILKVDKRGRAESRFWFNGRTDDGTTDVIFYLLIGVGTIDLDWPPSATTTMTMDTWEMKVDGESGPVRNRSCVGEDDFVVSGNGLADEMVIKVKLEN